MELKYQEIYRESEVITSDKPHDYEEFMSWFSRNVDLSDLELSRSEFMKKYEDFYSPSDLYAAFVAFKSHYVDPVQNWKPSANSRYEQERMERLVFYWLMIVDLLCTPYGRGALGKYDNLFNDIMDIYYQGEDYLADNTSTELPVAVFAWLTRTFYIQDSFQVQYFFKDLYWNLYADPDNDDESKVLSLVNGLCVKVRTLADRLVYTYIAKIHDLPRVRISDTDLVEAFTVLAISDDTLGEPDTGDWSELDIVCPVDPITGMRSSDLSVLTSPQSGENEVTRLTILNNAAQSKASGRIEINESHASDDQLFDMLPDKLNMTEAAEAAREELENYVNGDV